MIKRKIIETIKEYDESGKLTRETITETTEDDNNTYYPYQPYTPYTPYSPSDATKPWWVDGPTCTCNCSDNNISKGEI